MVLSGKSLKNKCWLSLAFCAVFLLASEGGHAQGQVAKARSWGGDLDYGFLFLHSQDIAPIGQSYPAAINLNYSAWLLGEKHWNTCNCYPRLGLSLGFHHFDNPEVLGVGVPLYGFLEPWYRLGGNWYFNFRGGAGMAWLSTPYDAIDNPLNLSYSLPLSAFVMVGVGLGYQISPQWRIQLQARYNHTSNGGIREPNKGLNYPTASLGLDYSPKALSLQTQAKKSFQPEQRKKSLSARVFAAGQAAGTVGEGVNEQDVTYLVSGVELRFSYQVSRISAIAIGGEWINNQAHRKRVDRWNLNRDHNQAAFLIGHEFLLGKFVFSQMAGIYLHKEFGQGGSWYQRYGLIYYPWPQLGIGPNIKVHGHDADFLDLGLSYRFNF